MIDFNKIKTYPIAERKNKFTLAQMIPLENDVRLEGTGLDKVADAVIAARKNDGRTIVMLGGGRHDCKGEKNRSNEQRANHGHLLQ